LRSAGLAYPCACSRQRITAAHAPIGASGEAVYPGFCRQRLSGATARLWRARVPAQRIDFEDRWMGAQSQQLDTECGDFALRRADGPFSYHLACVADDAASGITDVVRGADLISVTPRQIWLQSALGLSTPRYLHVPVITNPLGQKLSKQTGATAVDTTQPMAALQRAWQHLGFCAIAAQDVPGFFAQATAQWARRFNPD
jgi:glutamyl-Q tRNA(Asp) synthetase